MSFKSLKSKSQEELTRLRHLMIEEDRLSRRDGVSEKWEVRDRAVDALHWTGHHELASSIAGCRAGARCGSLWCPDCRFRTVENHHEKVARTCRINGWGNDDLWHVTAHMGVSRVDAEDVLQLLEDDDAKWRRFRHRCEGLWVNGVYEFELVSYKKLMQSNDEDSPVKKRQLKQMIDASGKKLDDVFVYVHWHGLSNQHPGQWLKQDYHLWNEVTNSLEKAYRANASGVYVQALNNKNSFSHNLSKLNSYPFKNAVRFKHSFVGSRYTSKTDDVGMTNEELSSLVRLYHEVQGYQKRRLFKEVSNFKLVDKS